MASQTQTTISLQYNIPEQRPMAFLDYYKSIQTKSINKIMHNIKGKIVKTQTWNYLHLPYKPPPYQSNHHQQDITKKKLNNNPFGDVLQNKAKDVTRILFQNVGGLELSSTGHTLEVTCQSIKQYNIDIACLAETNTNWDHPKAKKQIYNIKKQFWKRSKLTTAMSTVPWKTVHKPGGVAILSNPLISPRVIREQQDPTGMGRWTSITINGQNKTKVTIISAYRVCLTTIKAAGPNTAFCQQWDMLEEKGEKKNCN